MPAAIPAQHLSIRVPWHDTAWDGRVCADPARNTSCLVLKRIAEDRDDAAEACCAGKRWGDLDEAQRPPCVAEHTGFLSAEALVRNMRHPYKKNNPKLFAHFADTPYRHGAFGAAAVPFRWMLRSMVDGKDASIAETHGIPYRREREDAADDTLGFSPAFVTDCENQRLMLDGFFRAVEPDTSLCFFYAKRTPLSESTKRVLVGVGLVTAVGRATEYAYNDAPPGAFRSMAWEREVHHSIRPDGRDGFVLPYQQVLALATRDERIDPARFVAFAPDEAFESFSYGTEHVSNDHAIASLLAFVPVLERLEEAVEGPWGEHLRWVNDQLNRLWSMRGPFPGLGAALQALGLARGTLLAWRIAALQAQAKTTWTEDPWAVFEAALADPSRLGDTFREDLSPSVRKLWQGLRPERRALLKLLSRFDLRAAQAARFYEPATREGSGIAATDAELLANPYLLYLLDRGAPDAIGLDVVDRGMRPDDVVREEFPLPAPSAIDGDMDARRVGAFVVHALESAALDGHTVQTRAQVVRAVEAHAARPRVPCTSDVLDAQLGDYAPWVEAIGPRELQLDRYRATAARIEREVNTRVNVPPARRHALDADWRALIDAAIAAPMPSSPDERALEEKARAEKAAALAELFGARLSVLVGPAGTGKTTLLRALCAIERVKTGGVLLLAPTGKARVQLMKSAAGLETRTLAQSLLTSKRYDPLTGAYRMQTTPATTKGFKTVIIDECSMLTEEALAATLEDLTGVERLILVGDPRQLPPIGAGRPFVDLVERLRPDGVEGMRVRVGRSYAELTVPRRQAQGAAGAATSSARDDVLLASWFAGGAVHPGADEVWDRVASGKADGVEAIRWDTPEELDAKLTAAIVGHLGLKGPDDEAGFSARLGGGEFNGELYFHPQGKINEKGCGPRAEEWQVLSPVRANPWGVAALNRMIQARFRPRMRERSLKREWRKVPAPAGRDGILYGDKVICVANGKRDGYAGEDDKKPLYIANGDIGVVVGEYRKKAHPFGGPKNLQVEFKNHPRYRVTYWHDSDFAEEGSDRLELAYALTVHKAQGSEFDVVFVVAPNPCRPLSRELLYTALTRQTRKVVLLHQGDLHKLRDFSGSERSEVSRRLTSLLRDNRRPLTLVERGQVVRDEGLVHRTRRGELVRSKSELILANMLFVEFGVTDYVYEAELRAPDGSVRYPDFFVEDAAAGMKLYIEHLGLLDDPTYARRWAAKERWYRAQGILPLEEDGGPEGTLVTTTEVGGFDEPAVRARIARALGRP